MNRNFDIFGQSKPEICLSDFIIIIIINMHGRKKVVQTETEKKVLREKAAAYSAVASAVMDKKQKKDHNEESLLLTEKLLKSNPDFYSLWNFRRHILIHIYPESFGIYKDITQSVPFSSRIALVESTVKTIVQKELDMSADGIKKNSKSCKFYVS